MMTTKDKKYRVVTDYGEVLGEDMVEPVARALAKGALVSVKMEDGMYVVRRSEITYCRVEEEEERESDG